jgi:hypothetical protein
LDGEARCCEAALGFPDFNEGLDVCGVFEAWVVPRQKKRIMRRIRRNCRAGRRSGVL